MCVGRCVLCEIHFCHRLHASVVFLRFSTAAAVDAAVAAWLDFVRSSAIATGAGAGTAYTFQIADVVRHTHYAVHACDAGAGAWAHLGGRMRLREPRSKLRRSSDRSWTCRTRQLNILPSTWSVPWLLKDHMATCALHRLIWQDPATCLTAHFKEFLDELHAQDAAMSNNE